MAFRLRIDVGSVQSAASAVRAVGADLDGAPGGAALRTVSAALPGGELARAAASEAAEWATEMREVGEVFARWSAALTAAAAAQRTLDARGTAALR